MEVSVLASARAEHQLTHQSALVEGFSFHGIEAKEVFSIQQVKTKYVACWGWRNGKILRQLGHEVLVMERGYIGDRFKYTSLSWNGLNGHAEFPDYPVDNGQRFASHGGVLRPWREDGDYVLILGQVPGDMSLKGKNMIPWYEDIADAARTKLGMDVHFRPHPDLAKKGLNQRLSNAAQSQGDLANALSRAAVTVCFNSNASVDSILAGIPCVIGDEGSMAYEVCSKSFDDIIRPVRETWAHRLAFKQWSIDEIRSGVALYGIVKK